MANQKHRCNLIPSEKYYSSENLHWKQKIDLT